MSLSQRAISILLLLTTFLSSSLAHAIPTFDKLPSNVQSRQAPKLKAGAWIITYKPTDTSLPLYKGPLRITTNETTTFISGDLFNGTVVPNPADGSPILPRANYWAYLRTTSLSSTSNGGFNLGLEFWKFEGLIRKISTNDTKWADEPLDGGYTASLSPAKAPTGFPDSASYFEGDVKTADGKLTGRFTMGWVSTYVRRIKIEIGTAPGLAVPLSTFNGAVTWKSVFDKVGYQVDITIGKRDIPEPNTPGLRPGQWTDEEQHAAMLKYRGPTDFDKEFKYFLLVTRLMKDVTRGAMIDDKSQFNGIPREGTCMASEWIVGTTWDGLNDTKHEWSPAIRGKKFYELEAPWFRTAVHEIGHMFNLPHPSEFEPYIMTDTETWQDSGEQGLTEKKFPDNITPETFVFGPLYEFLMQHRPDTHVRPGWIDYGMAAQFYSPPSTEALPPQ